jgi:hypothetical protein
MRKDHLAESIRVPPLNVGSGSTICRQLYILCRMSSGRLEERALCRFILADC